MTLACANWETDKSVAEQLFIYGLYSFEEKLEEMKLKQQFHDSQQPFTLPSNNWSFPGWESDLQKILEFPSLKDSTLQQMYRKQNIHDGDRSDEQLSALDALTATLSYPQWQLDSGGSARSCELPKLVRWDIG